ncbi:PF08878 domain protein [Streptococcus sp. CM6]|nr:MULTISPECIES: Hachiman antiphage defense system protein HamA [Streptococcus]EUC82646.1 PF08878 domain protein [Streptococcus sp. CM6]MCY7083677.1 DUF1837 domain-containing protein [Streptococcus oralis]MCY7107298.1 DUF1837 domain-containing protein [Streptococcus oralis]
MMLQLLDGVTVNDSIDYKIIEIRYLSDELKEKIKNELIVICHGEYALSSASVYHTFERTIAELVNYRLSNEQDKRVGAIGELILNVIIRALGNFEVISPFFNLEERNVKKGFDIIAVDSNNDIWIIESKAGELGTMLDANSKVSERINMANRDLVGRLNRDNAQLWLNAINSVRSSVDYTDEKKTVINILETLGNTNVSNDKNVLLGGIVFCGFNTTIELRRIKSIYQRINTQSRFSKLQIIAIQKETFQAVVDFLNTLHT